MQETNWFVAHPEVMRYILKHEEAQQLIDRMCASPLVIQCDEIIHTDERPFCGDHYCPCHWNFSDEGNAEYHALIEQPIEDGLFTEEEAVRFLYGKQV